MNVRLAAAMAIGLAGCAPQAAGFGGGVPAADPCGAARVKDYVGRTRDAVEAAKLGQPARVIPHGGAATLDFRPDRINFELGRDGRVSRIYCG